MSATKQAVSRRKPGRPKEKGTRVRANLYIRPTTLKEIDALVVKDDAEKSSRGKIVDRAFES